MPVSGRQRSIIEMARIFVPLLCCCALAALEDGEYLLRLEQAVAHDGRSHRQALHVELIRQGGAWRADCFAHCPTFNKGESRGRVSQVPTADGETAAMLLALDLVDDPWVKGGSFRVRLALTGGAASLSGRFTGTFRETAVSGVVNVRRRGLPPVVQRLTVAGGVHPRLFFGPDQLADLQAAAATQPGRQLVDRLRQRLQDKPVWQLHQADAAALAVGHGLLYQLTGDEASAGAAEALIWERMRKAIGGPAHITEAPEVARVAIAYDLCYPAWDPAFRTAVTAWLEGKAQELVAAPEAQTKVDAQLHGNAVVRSAALLAGLAIAGDRGRFKPRPAVAVLYDVPLPAAERLQATVIDDWQSGRLPRRWLHAGPFLAALDEDVLTELGGSGAYIPKPKDKVSYQGKTLQFKALDRSWLVKEPYTDNQPAIDVLAPIDRNYHKISCYFTGLRFRKDHVLRFSLGASHAVGARAYIGGQLVEDGDYVAVKAGVYPLMIRVEVGATQAWGKMWMAPTFTAVRRAEAERAGGRTGRQLAVWQIGYDRWRAAGWPVLTAAESITGAVRHLRRFIHFGVGEAGLTAEGMPRQDEVIEALLPAWLAAQRCLGRPLTIATAPIETVPYLAARSTVVGGRLRVPTFGRSTQPVAASTLAYGLPALDPARAALVRRCMQLTGSLDGRDPLAVLFALLAATEESVEPAAMPAVVVDRRQGAVIQRTPAVDGAAVVSVLQVGNGRDGSPLAVPEAGGVRLFGHGREWIVGTSGENLLRTERLKRRDVGLADVHTIGPRRSLVQLDLGPRHDGLTASRSWYADLRQPTAVFVCSDRLSGDGEAVWQLGTVGKVVAVPGGFRIAYKDGPQLFAQVVEPKNAKVVINGSRVQIAGRSVTVVLSLGPDTTPVPVTAKRADGALQSLTIAGQQLQVGAAGLSAD